MMYENGKYYWVKKAGQWTVGKYLAIANKNDEVSRDGVFILVGSTMGILQGNTDEVRGPIDMDLKHEDT
jgi:hypothetical protein